MSRWSKIGWVVCAISFLILLGTRFVLTGWTPVLFFPLGLFLGSFVFSIVVDIKYYFDFFTMKTTKYGLNMGVMILLFFVFIVAINFISVRHNISWDMTKERVNSLAEPTLNLLEALEADIKVTVFYLGAEARTAKAEVKEILQRYKSHTPHFKVEYVDAYVHQMRANEYLKDARLSGLTVFVELGDKKVEVSAPVVEDKLTSALIKVTRGEMKKVYFLTGHGERSIEDGAAGGVKSLVQALERVSFEVEELNLFDSKIVPTDADVLAIVGPKSPYILSEIEVIEKFLKRGGGGVMVAADPNQKHQLSDWLKKFGVGFKDNLVVSPFVVLTGRGQTVTAGRIYDSTHKITQKFGVNTLTIFDWTSELESIGGTEFEVREIIQTDGNALSVVFNQGGGTATTGEPQQRAIAMSVTGKFSDESSSGSLGADFRLVVFGDSDFVSERDIIHYGNMDLALNSVAYLAGEEEVLGITPNTWSDTPARLTSYQMRGVILGGFSIPVIMLILAVIVFYRRRSM